MDKRRLLIDEKEGPALQHCFEMYATGNCSFGDLADYLNENGFISRSGQAFRDDTLRSMLENPIYIGIIEYQGAKKETYLTYEGKHQPLVSKELFNQAASVRSMRGNDKSRVKKDNKELKEKYMVQNLICCETCRRKLRVYPSYNDNRIHYYYRDFSEDRGLDCKDSKKTISAIFVEGLELCFLSSIILPRNWIDQIIAEGAEKDTYQEINEQINKIKTRMERRCDAYAISGIYQNYEKFERDQKADQNLIDELIKKLPKDSAVINTQITLTSSLIDLFLRATKQERYDIVHFLFSRIYVDLTSHRLTAFEPKPEFDFLFSTFAEVNGWKKDGSRYLFSTHELGSYDEFLKVKSKEWQKRKSISIHSHYQKAAEQGFFLGARAPFGYIKISKPDSKFRSLSSLIKDPRAADAVRKCFEMYATGKYSCTDIANYLNKNGFTTGKSRPFQGPGVYEMLHKRTYLGQIVYQGRIYEGQHEAIISNDLWDRVQKISSSRKF